MKIRTLLFTLLLFVLALTACTTGGNAPGDTGDNSPALIGGWNAVMIDNVNVIQPTVPNIIFGEDGTVTGNSSCNGFNGRYTADATNVTIGQLTYTEMGCMDMELMNQETRFLEALTRVTGYTREGDTLNLLAADGTIIITLTQVMG